MGSLASWNIVALDSAMRMAVALILFFGIIPYLIFPRHRAANASSIMQRAIWMAFLTIAAVHFLTLAHMYSAFSLLVLYALTGLWTLHRQFDTPSRRSLWFGALALFGEIADRRITMGTILGSWGHALSARLRAALRQVGWGWIGAALALGALGIVMWSRFVPVFQSPALPFSDSPLDLAWTKYPVLGILYHNKIYPRGLYTFMSALSLLSGTNPIIVLRFMDPGLSVLVVAAVAYLVYRSTDSLTVAAVVTLLLGVSHLIPYANLGLFEGNISQQFGTAFALLYLAFAISYLQTGRRHDLTTAAVAGGTTAFIHPVAAGLVIVITVALLPFALVTLGTASWRRYLQVTAGVALVAGFAVLPVSIALLSGESWHTASLSFLAATTSGGVRGQPPAVAYVASLASLLAVLAVVSLVGVWISGRSARTTWFSRQVILAGVAAVLVAPFLLPTLGLPSVVLAERSVQSTTIGTAIGAGVIWSLVEAALDRRWLLTAPATIVALLVLLNVSPPNLDNNPVTVYPYYTDQMIYQTLRAEASLVPQSWTLITGPTGYALVVGDAYHQYPDSFLAMVKRLPESPAKWVKAARRLGMSVSQTYVVMAEKVVPYAYKLPPSQVKQRLRWGRQLTAWVAANSARLHIHPVVSDAQVSVWYFSIPVDP